MLMKNHTYHLVEISPWPILGGLSAMNIMISMISWFHLYTNKLLLLGSMSMILIMYQWWRDISREASYQGLHTTKVLKGLRWGMILFIISEIFFFISFFWSFYHSSLSSSIEIGMICHKLLLFFLILTMPKNCTSSSNIALFLLSS